ncbi:hypothetical protein [Helicobacter sp. T3_23-1056]
MAKIDALKEQLKILRFWLGSAMAIMVAIIGWLITSYEKISSLLVIASFVAIVSLLFVIIAISVIMNKKVKIVAKLKK